MNFTNPTPYDSSFALILIVILLISFILGIILFIKLWFACSDVVDIRKTNARAYDLCQDMQFWARAKFESDKRLGVITDVDLAKAEAYINNSPEQ